MEIVMPLDMRKLLPICVLCGCFFFTQKSHAFDYEKYNSDHHKLRSLTPHDNIASPSKNQEESKSHLMKELVSKVLDAMQSDAVPAKLFDTNTNFSIYFKPAKISKIGITYKF